MGWLLGPAHAEVAGVPAAVSAADAPAAKQASTETASTPPATTFTLAEAVLLSPHESPDRVIVDDAYAAGNWELQFLAGGYFKSSLGPKGPHFNYLPMGVRLGRICTPPIWESSWMFGGIETLVELTAAPIISGPGSILGGPSLVLRRHFACRPDQCLVPYIQGGAGIVFTDAGDDHNQGAIGQDMEFLLQAQIGLRARLSENWTFDVEGGFQHISNAGLADRNGGINAFGAAIGFTYTLPCRR